MSEKQLYPKRPCDTCELGGCRTGPNDKIIGCPYDERLEV